MAPPRVRRWSWATPTVEQFDIVECSDCGEDASHAALPLGSTTSR